MHPKIPRRTFALLLSSAAFPLRAPAQSASTLEIGVIPNISARVLMAQYQPMREYLTRELSRPVQLSTAPNWLTFHQRTLALDYDVIVTACHVARLAQLDRGYVPLLACSPDMKGMIACASDRPMRSISDLRGQTLVLSNPQSLVALRGLQWLAENGLQRGRDFNVINTPTDDSVGNVIVRGDAIAAMLSGGELRAIPEALRARIQVLTTFTEVPGFVIMASPRLTSAEALRTKELLLQFSSQSDEGRAFLAATGFSGLHEIAAGLMESMDAYVAATRKLLTAAS